MTAFRTLSTAALVSTAWGGPALAATARDHAGSPLTLPLVLLAIGAAVVIAAVAVLRLYRSAYQGKPKHPPRDGG